MQKKQMIQFGVLLVLILALAGTYAGIRSYSAKQEAEKSKKEAEAVVPLTAFEPDSVTAIRYDMDGTVYTFERDGETWKASDQDDLVMNSEKFSDFLKQAGDITSTMEVQTQEEEDYGFTEPARTVTITTEKGTSSLIFGMKNEMLGQYYVKTSENSKIYLVDSQIYTTFDKRPEDFEQEETQTDADKETEADKETAEEENEAR